MQSREVLKKLAREGFEKVSQKGSHIKLRHPDGRMVIVPHPKQDLPPGTLRNIEKQANITF
ncbi:MAG: type II toxin-antitoxin system HicA family toxin [Desulfovibrio sp.]|nr:type II toxin-antitoxin system HicA family toxin [Desulfovibrio sp.]